MQLVFLSWVFILLPKADCPVFVLHAEEALREYSSWQEKEFLFNLNLSLLAVCGFCMSAIHVKYSTVSFCDGSFYDDSLLRPLSSRTEHSRLVVHHCRNSSVLSVLSALLDLFGCARVSSFSILVQLY